MHHRWECQDGRRKDREQAEPAEPAKGTRTTAEATLSLCAGLPHIGYALCGSTGTGLSAKVVHMCAWLRALGPADLRPESVVGAAPHIETSEKASAAEDYS
jgi:hypothetical protein